MDLDYVEGHNERGYTVLRMTTLATLHSVAQDASVIKTQAQ